MKELFFSEKANRDLEENWNYIADDNIAAANRVVFDLLEAINQLWIYPKLGRAGIETDMRELVVTPYIVTYRIEKNIIHILDIVHGSRRK